jgi:hypothetical protein
MHPDFAPDPLQLSFFAERTVITMTEPMKMTVSQVMDTR